MATYTRLEMMNLGMLYDDTQDLSTIRGGSLALLMGADKAFPPANSVSGASQAVCQGGAGVNVAKLGRVLQHGTIAIATHTSGQSFDKIGASLSAKCRFEQMQSATLHYPDIIDGKLAVCQIDHLRPAARSDTHAPGGKQDQSTITKLRRDFGRRARQAFYDRELKRAGLPGAALKFTKELDELSGDSANWGRLRDKIAVVYFDGDGMGSHFASLKTWEEYVAQSREYRNNFQACFLGDLLSAIGADSDWRLNDEKARLETLLWGGDEMRFVVPAWKGFELLRLFYKTNGGGRKLGGKIVTHSGGIVFAHYKAPIRELSHMAKDLAEFAKTHRRFDQGDCCAYQVLESFDTNESAIGGNSMQRMYPFAANDLASLLVTPAGLDTLEGYAATAHSSLPRRQVYALARQLQKGRDPAAALKDQIPKIFHDVTAGVKKLFESCTPADWFHLNELWDYLAPRKESEP